MSRSLGVLTLDLIAKTGGFVSGMGRAERETRKSTSAMQKQINQLKEEAIDLGQKSAMAATAVIASAAAIGVAFYKSGAQSVDALAKMSDQIGIATEDLGALRYAAQQMSGMAEGTFDVSMRRMARRITEAADGAGPAVGALKSLRLEAGELARMSPDAQFRAIADAMGQIPNQGERLRATMAIFDTEGVPLINTLSKGADAIREMEEQAHAMGLTISRIDAAQVEAANDALAASASTVNAFKQQLAVQFAPVVKAATDLLGGMSGEIGSMSDVAETTFNNVIQGLAFVANAADGAKRTFEIAANWIIGAWSTVAEKIATAFSFVLKAYDLVPGIDLSDQIASIEQFAQQSSDIAGMAFQEIDEILSRPLAGNAFKEFVANAREAGRAAAEAAAGSGVIEIPEMPDIGAGVTDKEREAIDKRLQALQESFYNEKQLLGAKYVEEQRLLDDALAVRTEALETADLADSERLAEKLAMENEFNSLRQQSTQRYEEGVTAITEKEAKARKSVLGNTLSSLSSLMGSENRKMFEIGKTAAVANTIVSTHQAAMDAYKAMAGIPVVGPALGAAAAAAAVLAGAGSISAIQSTQFGGGGGVSGSFGGAGHAIPTAPAPTQLPENNAGNVGQGVNITLNVSGSIVGAGGVDELRDYLMESMSEQIRRGDYIMIDTNSRNGRMLRSR